MVPSIQLSRFPTSFLSLFTFKTNIMLLVQSIIIAKTKLYSISNYVFHFCFLFYVREKHSQSRLVKKKSIVPFTWHVTKKGIDYYFINHPPLP